MLRYDAASWQGAGSAGVGLGHVTNYAQNMDGMVWDLGRLEQHLGAAAWALLWGRIQRSAALMVAAALKDMQASQAELQLPPESTFELLGLDYLVDTAMTPWLLEVNGTPSLAVDHGDAKVEQMIHTQKAGMVSDMFRLLGVSTRFKPRYDARRVAMRRARATAGTSASPANVDNGEGALAEGSVAEDRGDEEDLPCAIATAKGAEQLPALLASNEQPAAHAAMALEGVDTTPRPSKHLSPGVDSPCTKSDQLGVSPAARSRVGGHSMHSSPGSCSPARRLARRLVGRRRHRVICSPLQDSADTLQQGGKLDATQQQQQQQQQQGQQQQQAADPTSHLAATTTSASTATVVQPAGQQGASGKCVTHRSSVGPVQGSGAHRGPVPRAPKAASGVAPEEQQGASSCRAKLAGLPAYLVEALCPSSPSTLMARVAAELDNRGGFQPLMHLFPLPPSHSHTSSSSSRLAAPHTSQNGQAGRVMLGTATEAAATKEEGRAAAGRAQVGSAAAAAAAGGGAATMWLKASPELVGSCASPRLVSVGRRRKVLLSPSSPPAARGMVTPPSGLGCEGRGVTHPLRQGCDHPQRATHERPDLPGQPGEQRRVNGHWQQEKLSSATDARVGRNAWDAIADVRATIHLPASAYTCTAGFEPRADGAGRGAEAMSADDRISGAAAASTIPWREPDMLLQGLLHSRCVVTP
ncbi:hypothetical protein QJQ45_024202 [Haematococcus lacustris]|nr:hypothetical protein QJQ45_024202 [Haematococcus lacustris]